MTEEHGAFFEIDLSESIREAPAKIDVRATYGDTTIDEFAKQYGIEYLGLPFVWSDEDQGWRFLLGLENVALFTRFVEGLGEMDFDDLQWDESDPDDESPEDVVTIYRFRCAPGE